ncbi:BZ3500_MvSof-1268-A1-R1_Chr8-1g09907 [Microbotryum saponariae]|uniref:BZ3500_MvSof-1268-A1-R1_Chr8-1g09907 protein n=1 Tax=Microbotryum saponariae TaxID=289078 RepID=A0A2X0M7S2_9BASI|nr:BZ3500_MvSof-1268-A1-R1_Chr8-1g09907 [Microbotryum saponariae]SDA08193.1 BZ3501_MvSof-1269-A2-R1_Chr8-1g09630 [Microbotryum saponariae]
MSPCPVRVPYETLLQNLDFGTLESIWNAKTLQHQLTSGCYKWNRYNDDDRDGHGSVVSNHDYSTFPTSRPRIGFWQSRWSKVKSSSIRSRVLTCLALVLVIIGAVGLSGDLGRIKLPEHVSVKTVRDWLRLSAGWDARRDRTNVLSKKSGSNLDESTWVTCLSRHRETAHQGSQSCWGLVLPRAAWRPAKAKVPTKRYNVMLAKQILSYRPNLKYLMTDSWSGLGGQFTTVLPLLFLASTTSRIAVIPSFNDEHHYKADVIVKMSMLYDLERFRQITGILFVEQDDVKVRDPKHTLTQEGHLGCYVSNWSFDQGLSYGHHNIHQTIIRIDRPGVAGKECVQ